MVQNDLDRAVEEIRKERCDHKKDVISIKDGLTIDETKVSTLVISFSITLIFALVMYFKDGDISTNLTNILIAFIAAIGGITAIDKYKSNNSTGKPVSYK
jgi:accessory gene regulator protein AgrB